MIFFFNFFIKIFFFLTHDTDDTVNHHIIEAHRMERIPYMDTFIIHQMAYLYINPLLVWRHCCLCKQLLCVRPVSILWWSTVHIIQMIVAMLSCINFPFILFEKKIPIFDMYICNFSPNDYCPKYFLVHVQSLSLVK